MVLSGIFINLSSLFLSPWFSELPQLMQPTPRILKSVKSWWTNTILKTVLLLSLLVCILDSAWCLPWADNFISVCLHFYVCELTATIGSLEDWGLSVLLRRHPRNYDWNHLLILSSLIWNQAKGVKFLMFRGGISCSFAFPQYKAL